jgi:chromosome segregation ATPase
MTTPGASEGERWEKQHLGSDEDNPFRDHFLFWAVKDGYSRLAVCFAEKDADQIVADHNARAAEQTIADLRASNRVLSGMLAKSMKELHAQDTTIAELRAQIQYLGRQLGHRERGQEAAEQTIAELRKALEAIATTDHEDMNAGYTAWVLSTEALAAIAATEKRKSS